MIKKPSTALLLMTISSPAYAQNEAAFCKLWLSSRAAPTSSVADAAYKPGVDVHGKAVVPADVNDGAMAKAVPQAFRFPVTMDLAQKFAPSLPQGLEMKAGLGMIETHEDGTVTYNGVDITKGAAHLCGLPYNAGAAPDDPPYVVEQPAPSTPVQSSAPVKLPPMADNNGSAAAMGSADNTAPAADEPITQDDIIWGQDY